MEVVGNKVTMPTQLADYLRKVTGMKTASGAVNKILREGIAVEKKIRDIGTIKRGS